MVGQLFCHHAHIRINQKHHVRCQVERFFYTDSLRKDFTIQMPISNYFIGKMPYFNYFFSKITMLRGDFMNIKVLESRPAGYAYLLDMTGLTGIPHWHTSFVSSSGTHRSKVQDRTREDIYPVRYWPGSIWI